MNALSHGLNSGPTFGLHLRNEFSTIGNDDISQGFAVFISRLTLDLPNNLLARQYVTEDNMNSER